MVSTPSTILGLELQGTGDNINSWGALLNALFSQVEEAAHSVVDIVVNADVTLTSTNYQSNESRRAGHRFIGTGGFTVTLPEKPRVHIMQNDCTDDVTIAVGLTTVTLEAGERDLFWTDGTTAYLMGFSTLNTTLEDYLPKSGGTMAGAITLAGDATEDLQPVTKQQLAAATFNTVNLPDQAGNAGKFVTTDGTNASWADLLWSMIGSTPTTLTGYGITDAVSNANTTAFGRRALEEPTPVAIDDTDSPYSASFGQAIFGDSTNAAIVINLPAATAEQRPITVVDSGAASETNNITLNPDGSESIDGETSIEMDMNRLSLKLVPFDGSWKVA